MPRVGLRLAMLQGPRPRSALATPRGRSLGFLLIAVGLALLSVAMAPILASGATTQVCKADGTDDPKIKCEFEAENEAGVPLASLRGVDKPVDAQLAVGGTFIRNQTELERLGKALFWDQQVGSDGQACGTCHFSAGADPRTKNQVSPGLKGEPADITFTDAGFQGKLGPNHTLTAGDFPLHKLSNPDVRTSSVVHETNDVVSSSGVFFRKFTDIQANGGGLGNDRPAFDRRAFDNCLSQSDPQGFRINGTNTRRAEPRNTPTMINAMFNNRNFWDSRAQDVFNGFSPFGARDAAAVVFESRNGGTPVAVHNLRINFASLSSQADGPPTNPNEMSCDGRTFPDVGHKLLTSTSTPLAQQDVSANDSLLGPISNSAARGGTREGLTRSYREMVERAFQPRWWQSNQTVSVPGVTGRRVQIEANFSLFWGLAVGAYMETLKADRTKIDRFFDTPFPQRLNVLGDAELRGLRLFESSFGTRPSLNDRVTRVAAPTLANGQPADLRCTACHGGAATTAASIDAVSNDARIERMGQLATAQRDCAVYDAGHFHTGVRKVTDDPAVGGVDPFGNSLSETQLAINFAFGKSTHKLSEFSPNASGTFGLAPGLTGTTNCDGDNVRGTFKAPQLRNVELTGPYFHNGGQLTLRQVLDFYDRGGDFQDAREFDPNVHVLNLNGAEKSDLVAFLLALTDERVAFERDPFDHPGICFSVGAVGNEFSVQTGQPFPGAGANPTPRALDEFNCVGASGANGLNDRLDRFMNADPFSP